MSAAGATSPLTTRPTSWESTSTTRRLARLSPFIVLSLLALAGAWMLPGDTRRTGLLVVAGLTMVAAAVLIVVVPWGRLPPEVRHVPGLTFCVGVALLRHGAGASEAAYGGVLVLLPVIWQAIYGRRIDRAIALTLVPITLLAPMALLDGYPANVELPRTLLLIVLAVGIDATLQGLMATIGANDDAMRHLITASAELHAVEDPRLTVCQAVQQLLGADEVALFEGSGEAFSVTAATEAAAPWSPADVAHADALEPGRFAFVADHQGQRLLQLRLGSGPPAAVAVARWHEPGGPPRRPVLRSLVILGSHAGLALERADLVTALDRKANVDGLTGLPNRRAWDAELARVLDTADRTGEPLCMAVLDLDRFKTYNDTHGHLAGDHLLQEVAAVWQATLRGDFLARWGGEEFAILFAASTMEDAAAALERLRVATPPAITFSAGLSAHRPGESSSALMATADAALYQAKAGGRDRVVRASRPDGDWVGP